MRRLALALLAATASPALAAGDLLVAPTRVILEGGRGTEVVLNNVGTEPATYRVSLELRRMDATGKLDEVAPTEATARETTTLGLISYAPRRVTLPPNQPQTIRIGARLPEGLPDGEYRAHMLFRAIPDAQPAVPTGAATPGVSIQLTPIYGVTIPVIVRKGSLSASATISDVRLTRDGGEPALAFRLTRSGDRSVYGRIRVGKAGVAKPLFEARGVAIYTEVTARSVVLPVPSALVGAMTGAVTIQYLEDNDTGGLIAETQAFLR